MSYQFDGVCYPDPDSTLSAMAAGLSGGVVDVGGVPYALDVTPSAGNLLYSGVRLDNTGTFTKTVTVTLQPCQLLTLQDGLQLSWMVIGIWAVVFALLMLRRGV